MDISTYISNLCQHCGLEEGSVTVAVDENDDRVTIQLDVPEDSIGLFIGHHGETLAALQRMLRLVFQEEYRDKHVVLNINDYREERNEYLQAKAAEVARTVLDTGHEYHFPYMSSYERFVVHTAITEDKEVNEEVESVSIGEGRGRRLVVRLKGVDSHEQSMDSLMDDEEQDTAYDGDDNEGADEMIDA